MNNQGEFIKYLVELYVLAYLFGQPMKCIDISRSNTILYLKANRLRCIYTNHKISRNNNRYQYLFSVDVDVINSFYFSLN